MSDARIVYDIIACYRDDLGERRTKTLITGLGEAEWLRQSAVLWQQARQTGVFIPLTVARWSTVVTAEGKPGRKEIR